MTPHQETGPIRIPDQRLHVLLSSTSKKLVDERKAAPGAQGDVFVRIMPQGIGGAGS